MRTYMKPIIAFLVIFVISGCGGSSSASSQDKKTNGIWIGKQTIQGVDMDLQLVIYNKKMYGYTVGGQALFSGTGTLDGTSLSTQYSVYDYSSGIRIADGEIKGELQPEKSIVGTFKNSYNQIGTVNLKFNAQYHKDASISKIAKDFGTFSIDSLGGINGKYGNCNIVGKITVPDSTVNIYKIKYDLTNCGAYGGHYDGLGSILKFSDGDYLFSGMSNKDYMAFFQAKISN